MGVDEYRDREGDAEERTGLGQGEPVGEDEQDGAADRGYRDTRGRRGGAHGAGQRSRGRRLRLQRRHRERRHRQRLTSLLQDRSPETTVVAMKPITAAPSVVPGQRSVRLRDPCSTWLIGPTHRPRKRGSESSRALPVTAA